MTTRFQKLHITSRPISAYLLQCSQIPINALFCQFKSLFANTEMYEAIDKLRNYRIIYVNFIHEYGINFHELYFVLFIFSAGLDQYGEPSHSSMYYDLWINNPTCNNEYPDYTYEEHFGKVLPSYVPRAVVRDYIEGKMHKRRSFPMLSL